MQINNKFLDDLARVATGAAGVIAEAGQRLQQQLRENAPFGGGASSVMSAEEIEAVRIMAAKAREAQAALEARVAELEQEVARLSATGARPDKAATRKGGNAAKAGAAAKKAAGGTKRRNRA
jgi:hypothetical protein